MGYPLIVAAILGNMAALFDLAGANAIAIALYLAGALFLVGAIAVGIKDTRELIIRISRNWPTRISKRYKYWEK